MSYFAYFEQDNGCDYTIACGKEMVDLETDSPSEAIERIKEYLEDHGIENIDRVSIIKGVTIDNFFDLDNYREEEDRKNAAEKAEYERLKAKFGKKNE